MNPFHVITEKLLNYYDGPLASIVRDGTTGERYFELINDYHDDCISYFYIPFVERDAPISLENLDPQRSLLVKRYNCDAEPRGCNVKVADVAEVIAHLRNYFQHSR